ncbi:MAG: hypothetical protein ACLS3C_05760 [Oscillospiraceae bacterium]
MKKKNNTALYLSLTILALIWLVPIVTVFITSLKSNSDFFSGMGLFDLPELQMAQLFGRVEQGPS